MSLNSKHPHYALFLPEWKLCEHSYRGERVVKEMGQTYLPATSGMIEDGVNTYNSVGYNSYQAYIRRAVFHDFMADAVEALLGMMWSKKPVFQMPEKMAPLLDKASLQGESLEDLLRRVNERQLTIGRCGLLADMPINPDPTNPIPYIALYEAEHIINWDEGRREDGQDSLNLVVLDEKEWERTAEFSWQEVEKYRILSLGPVISNEKEGTTVYKAGQFRGSYSEETMVAPAIRGKSLDRIPFTFVNSKDLLPSPDDPPLIGLARLCMAIYRGEADYRQALFMQGQDTLVVIGGEKDVKYRIGANASINIKQGGDAKFIGVNNAGLSEMRSALENDKTIAQQKAGALVDTRSKMKESGDAMKTRIGAQTATLTQIALTGAKGLEKQLKNIAEWMGLDPEEVRVIPNLEFENAAMTGKELIDMMAAKGMGAPLSLETVHRNMRVRGMTDKDFEEELELIDTEEPLVESNPLTDEEGVDPMNPNKVPTDPADVQHQQKSGEDE